MKPKPYIEYISSILLDIKDKHTASDPNDLGNPTYKPLPERYKYIEGCVEPKWDIDSPEFYSNYVIISVRSDVEFKSLENRSLFTLNSTLPGWGVNGQNVTLTATLSLLANIPGLIASGV